MINKKRKKGNIRSTISAINFASMQVSLIQLNRNLNIW